ncbi:MAG: hypothetical protein PHG83_00035 [Patescibacteria group bacterium]|nr:hypothetical protein [Patescibacteria group bacterium]
MEKIDKEKEQIKLFCKKLREKIESLKFQKDMEEFTRNVSSSTPEEKLRPFDI